MTDGRAIENRNPAIQEAAAFLDDGSHLPEPLKTIFGKFNVLKNDLLELIDDHPQLTLALHDLISAKDKAIRAKVAGINKAQGTPVGSPIKRPDFD